MASTSPFNRSARKTALRVAEEAAQREVESEIKAKSSRRNLAQAQADAWWRALEQCEPDVVLAQLVNAFSDNDAAASAVGVSGREVSLVVVVPTESAVPDRVPSFTEAGNLSLKKATKTESADLYKNLVCGYVLVTLKEAFAVVPALRSAQIVAVRSSAVDVYGAVRPEVVLAGHCDRTALEGVHWANVSSVQIFNECFTSKLIREVGQSSALHPISTANEPDLEALLAAITFDEVGGPTS